LQLDLHISFTFRRQYLRCISIHCVRIFTENLREIQQRIEHVISGETPELYLGSKQSRYRPGVAQRVPGR
jgi:hypothetical protein